MRYIFIFYLLYIPCGLFAQAVNERALAKIEEAKSLFGEAALPLLEEAQQYCAAGPCADTTFAVLYRRLGVAYLQGYLSEDQALAFTDTSLHYYLKAYGNDHPEVASIQFNKSVIAKFAGRLELAANSLLEAIQTIKKAVILPETTRDSIQATYLRQLAAQYINIGDFRSARDYAQQGLQNADARWAGPHQIKRLLQVTIASSYYQEQQFGQALQYYERALSVFRPKTEQSLTIEEATIYENVGLCYLHLGDFRQAEARFNQSRNTFQEALQKDEERKKYYQSKLAYTWANFMLLYLEQGQLAKATAAYEEAMKFTDQAFEERSTIRASLLHQRAELALAEGQPKEALQFCDQAQLILVGEPDFNLNSAVLGETPYKLLDIIALRAQVFRQLGDQEAALQEYQSYKEWVHLSRRRFRVALSKSYIIQSTKPVFEEAIQLCLDLYQRHAAVEWLEQAYAFCTANKGVLLLEELQHKTAIQFGDISSDLVKAEETQRKALIKVQGQVANARPAEKDSLGALLKERQLQYDALLRDLAANYPKYFALKFQQENPPSISALQSNLEQGQVLLEYFIGQESFYFFLITKEKVIVESIDLIEDWQNDLALWQEYLRNAIEKDCEQTFIDLAYRLYQLLFEAVEEAWSDYPPTRIVLVPDGALHSLPFEALLYQPLTVLKGSQGFLLERYAFSYLYSSHLLLAQDNNIPQSRQLFGGFGIEYLDTELEQLDAMGFGKKTDQEGILDPCSQQILHRRNLGRLIYSDDEVSEIAHALDGDAFLNENATKATFLSKAREYQLLHLAMHSAIDPQEPLNSALLFQSRSTEDFVLRAAQIYEMELGASLAVLSACNTAVGQMSAGNSPMSLARAFHYAGISSVIASLWELPDYSAASMMPLFYQKLEDGLPKDLALQQAKLSYLRDDDISSALSRDPAFWAAPVLIGEVAVLKRSGAVWRWWPLSLGAIILLWLLSRRRYRPLMGPGLKNQN